MPNRVRVFIASSLDGFIAGPDDEIDWLDGFEGAENTFTPFFSEVGAVLLGRRTYDVVAGMEGPWNYGDTPVLVATTRPLESSHATVRAVGGSVGEMVAEARRVAGERDVYIDGGALIRSALDADLIDRITVTVIPIVLGEGIPLFAGAERRHALDLLESRPLGAGLVQLDYSPRPS